MTTPGSKRSVASARKNRSDSGSGDSKNRPNSRSSDADSQNRSHRRSGGDSKQRPGSGSGGDRPGCRSGNGDSENRLHIKGGDSTCGPNRPDIDSRNGDRKNRPESRSGTTRPESTCITPAENKKMLLLEQAKQRNKEINARKEEKHRNDEEIRKQKAKDLAQNKKRRSATTAGGRPHTRYGAFSPLLTVGGGVWEPESKAWNGGVLDIGLSGLVAPIGKDQYGVYPRPPPNFRWPDVSSNKAHCIEIKSEGNFSRVAKRLHGPVGKQVCGSCQRKRAVCMEKAGIPSHVLY